MHEVRRKAWALEESSLVRIYLPQDDVLSRAPPQLLRRPTTSAIYTFSSSVYSPTFCLVFFSCPSTSTRVKV